MKEIQLYNKKFRNYIYNLLIYLLIYRTGL